MLTPLQHSDHILWAKPGETLLFVESGSAVDMSRGGRVKYAIGDRLRVKFSSGNMLWALDDNGRSVSVSREDMVALERQSKGQG